jgi:hypothetical protein
MRLPILSVVIAVGIFVCSGKVFARTASCPCNPCPCAPCTCGQSKSGSSKSQPSKSTTTKPATTKTETPTTQSKTHEGTRERGHDHGHSHGGGRVGVGANIDLSGIGHRTVEPDPFAVGGGTQPIAHTQEKPKATSKPHEAIKTNDFAGVELTGEKAKSEIAPTDPFRDVRLTGEQAKAENNPR